MAGATKTSLIKSTRRALKERYPAVFGGKWRPLCVGVVDMLVADMGADAPRRDLHRAIAARAGKLEYLTAVAGGGPRYDLQGNERGHVTAHEQEYAKQRLAQMEQARLRAGEEVVRRAIFLKAFEKSGLSTASYASVNGLDYDRVQSEYHRALREREQRREERKQLVVKLEASGLSLEEFAKRKNVRLAKLRKAVDYVASLRATATPTA
ncbi:ProQ/FinO family protein (plasmid) [Burkholderia vietnamiensis]|uniref:ProQ/FinO domain-containing protein n=1 Tax=Burkholderia vietnamiensis (strain G4 / LMG 22486) TaxID=269482 RepID=A4JVH2_BURVG|nr:conserved hypothetical protein [Burkholderia vietnamiensis G4]MCB4349463.1 ProQ/FinO family protein [Burkholderia vietnamiensis]